MFGNGSIYAAFNWFWLLGALLTISFYVVLGVFPHKKLRWLHAPVLLGAMAWLPSATPLSFGSWAIVGLIFNYAIKKRFGGWWSHGGRIIIILPQLHWTAAFGSLRSSSSWLLRFRMRLPQWWGNVQVFETMDSMGTAIRKTVADGETFGPKTW